MAEACCSQCWSWVLLPAGCWLWRGSTAITQAGGALWGAGQLQSAGVGVSQCSQGSNTIPCQLHVLQGSYSSGKNGSKALGACRIAERLEVLLCKIYKHWSACWFYFCLVTVLSPAKPNACSSFTAERDLCPLKKGSERKTKSIKRKIKIAFF